jgi:hypothetical protein
MSQDPVDDVLLLDARVIIEVARSLLTRRKCISSIRVG